MKSIKSNVFPVLAMMVAMPSLAQSLEVNPASVASSSTMPQPMPSVVYKNAATENQLTEAISVDQTSGLSEGTNTSPKVKFFRPRSLSMTSSSSNMFVKNDRASFTVNAPTPTVNGVLSFVGTVYQTQPDSSVTKWLQVLSLAATRRINAEYAYSAPINKSSSFNSVISYSLHPASDSGRSSEVAASIQYSVKF